ncbi:CvpA family protein [Treponema phagedenis]|uniref:CvpA family protein n=1 Tax=Treponema phagedenis TaxID=162 RepID=A0A0B7H2D7_TREPH|nr:CvpA family protein [Treponema phagedenis]QEJ97746.1 CvpA family protein [Treponema phagedenis]QEK01365.1 CvpA family protein [Treponema phagedenis]QEK03313.1 CvpA family protein [Treponema phagedenis]QEK06386.1 CvpA family protein [Treponema phagedenis]QEK08940.1 CvpA family protein [Treponema phagedenis]
MTIVVADLIFGALFLIIVVKVAVKGFIEEFFSKAAVLGALLAAVLFYKPLTPFVVGFIGRTLFASIVSFLLLFVVTYIGVKLLQLLVGSMFTGATMTNLDRALGFFLGIAEGLLVIALILIILHVQPIINLQPFLADSIFVKLLSPFIVDSSRFFHLIK